MKHLIRSVIMLLLTVGANADQDDLLEKWHDSNGLPVRVDDCAIRAWVDIRKAREDGSVKVLLHNDSDHDLFIRVESFWYARSRDDSGVEARSTGMLKYVLTKGRGSRNNIDGIAPIDARASHNQDVEKVSKGADIVVPIEMISRRDGSAHTFRIRIDSGTGIPMIDTPVNPLEKLLRDGRD